MSIPKNEEARWGTYHSAGGVKADAGDNDYESDDHCKILHKKKKDEWDGDGEITIVQGVYFKEMNI